MEHILLDFSSIEQNLKNYTLKNKGIAAIEIDKIIGSLGRYFDFTETLLPKRDILTTRYERIKKIMTEGGSLPPIQVYQILDNYFIIDGHHRVAVAKNELNAKYIDADVTEVKFNFELSPNTKYTFNSESTKAFLIKLEAYSFEKSTYLNNNILIKPLTVTELKSYATLNQEIEDFKKNYNNGELARKSKIYSSYTWYAQIFLPAVDLIEKEKILSKFPHRTYTDLYVWIQRHKYFLSQQAGHDVGFDYTAQDFAEKFQNKKILNILPPIFTDILKHLVK
jgi:hypothetical protein